MISAFPGTINFSLEKLTNKGSNRLKDYFYTLSLFYNIPIKKIFITSLFILSVCSIMVFALGRKPSEVNEEGVKTDGIVIHCATDKTVYSKYDAMIFTVTIKNDRNEELFSEKIFSDYVEPSSAVSLIAVDEEETRYSGYVGNRTDPGEDFEHYSVKILPKKMLIFTFYHRDLQKPILENDKSFSEISDRPGSYTIYAQIQQDLFKTKFPLVSNKIKITVTKK